MINYQPKKATKWHQANTVGIWMHYNIHNGRVRSGHITVQNHIKQARSYKQEALPAEHSENLLVPVSGYSNAAKS